jgi:hypothetical protein
MARVPHGSLAMVWLGVAERTAFFTFTDLSERLVAAESFRIITRSAVSLLLGSAQSIAYPHSVAGAQGPNA